MMYLLCLDVIVAIHTPFENQYSQRKLLYWVFYIDKTKKDRKPIQVNELSNLNSSLAGWQTFEMKSLEDLIL